MRHVLVNTPKYGPEVYDQIAVLWAIGVTTAEIGAQLKIPKNSICRMARNARLKGDLRFPERTISFKPPKPVAPSRPRHRPSTMARLRRPLPPPVPRSEHPLIWELNLHECKYPVTSDPHGAHRFCARPTRAGMVYCVEHDALCNQQPVKRVR